MDEQEKSTSFIVITFKEIGSTIMNVQYEGVTPLQLLTLAEYFQLVGKSKLMAEVVARDEYLKQQQLAIPENKIITAHR
jgi:hypothetical protein